MILQNFTFSSTICRRGLHGASKKIDSLIRVNHAGELGADRIYAGQMAILGMLKINFFNCISYNEYINCFYIGNTSVGPNIKKMWEQEKEHRNKFEQLINERRARPSLLFPLWNCAGFMLGAGI